MKTSWIFLSPRGRYYPFDQSKVDVFTVVAVAATQSCCWTHFWQPGAVNGLACRWPNYNANRICQPSAAEVWLQLQAMNLSHDCWVGNHFSARRGIKKPPLLPFPLSIKLRPHCWLLTGLSLYTQLSVTQLYDIQSSWSLSTRHHPGWSQVLASAQSQLLAWNGILAWDKRESFSVLIPGPLISCPDISCHGKRPIIKQPMTAVCRMLP